MKKLNNLDGDQQEDFIALVLFYLQFAYYKGNFLRTCLKGYVDLVLKNLQELQEWHITKNCKVDASFYKPRDISSLILKQLFPLE